MTQPTGDEHPSAAAFPPPPVMPPAVPGSLPERAAPPVGEEPARVQPPWWPGTTEPANPNEPTVFDRQQTISPDELPDGYSPYAPGETQVAWRILGFREDSPYNAVLQFADGGIPVLDIPLDPSTLTPLRDALDVVYTAQNTVPAASPTDDVNEAEDRSGGPLSKKARMAEWKAARRFSLGPLNGTLNLPGNTSGRMFFVALIGAFVVLAACGVFTR